MSGESVIDGHRGSVRVRVHSVANLWVRLSGARLLYQRLRVIQGGTVGPARENNTYNEAGINTGFERGTLNFFHITTMKLRITPIRIVIRVRCSCPFNSLRVVTVNAKTLAALSHVVSSCLAPNQLQFHNHIVIAHGAECMGITPSVKYQSNYKSRHSSSPNTALELKNEHPFEGNGRRHELPIRISRVRGWDNAGTLNASVCSLTNRTLRCSPATACGPVTSGYGGGSDSLDNLLRLPAHCEPLFAQLETVNEHYLRLKHVLLVIQNRARGYRYGALTTHIRARSGHLVAEIGFKGKHLLADTELHEIKGEHLFAETGIKGEHLFAETEIKAKKVGWQE